MEILVEEADSRVLGSGRVVFLLSMFGCAPCRVARAALDSLCDDHTSVKWFVSYVDRRRAADNEFVDRHHVTSFPTIWFVEQGRISDVTAKIDRDSVPAARRSLERELRIWLDEK